MLDGKKAIRGGIPVVFRKYACFDNSYLKKSTNHYKIYIVPGDGITGMVYCSFPEVFQKMLQQH